MSTCLEFRLGMCRTSAWTDGVLEVQPDALGDGGAKLPCQSIQPLGLFVRPMDPETDSDGNPTSGAAALYAHQGDQRFIMPVSDPTTIGNHPRGPGGSSVFHSANPTLTSFVYIDGEHGYQQMLAKYNDGEDRSLSWTLDTRNPATISAVHGKGHAIRLLNDGKIVLSSPGGGVYIEISDTKVIINGDLQVNGAFLAGGTAGEAPAKASELTNVLSAVNAALAAGLTVSGPKATLAAPIVVPTPGFQKLAGAG